MHQPGMIAAFLQHGGHNVFLADMSLIDVFNRRAVLRRQRLRASPDPIPQRLGKARIVENADMSGVEKPSSPPHSRPPEACP